jgi:hypothetical protein
VDGTAQKNQMIMKEEINLIVEEVINDFRR